MKYKCLILEDITTALLDGFDRHEEINRAWRTENGVQCLKEIYFTEDWDQFELEKVSGGLRETILGGGAVFGAFDNGALVGFASLEHHFFGSENQYLQLSMLHITKLYRGLGVGKVLFELCKNKAIEFGAKKIYISASSCENGQAFYKKVGCIPAKEINQRLYELEPYDCQIENVL